MDPMGIVQVIQAVTKPYPQTLGPGHQSNLGVRVTWIHSRFPQKGHVWTQNCQGDDIVWKRNKSEMLNGDGLFYLHLSSLGVHAGKYIIHWVFGNMTYSFSHNKLTLKGQLILGPISFSHGTMILRRLVFQIHPLGFQPPLKQWVLI